MSKILTAIFSMSLCASLVSMAQIPSEQIRRLHPAVLSSNYSPYELSVKATNEMLTGTFDFPKLSPTPDGWTPFYISHYGRHGQRYHYSADDYKWVAALFEKAEGERNLTDLGRQVAQEIKKICADAEMRAGDLTPLGREQHAGVAIRMMQNFPEVFAADSLRIDARSTPVPRCILSMGAFCKEIIAKYPAAEIYCDASKRDMAYMCRDKEIGDGKGEKKDDKAIGDFYAKREYKGDLQKRLFRQTPQEVAKDMDYFVRTMYYMVIALAGVDVRGLDKQNCALSKVFSQDELVALWEKQNFYWYSTFANSPINGGSAPKSARWLLANIIAEADSAVSGGRTAANLRFGHDTAILPLIALLNIDKKGDAYTDLERLSEYWQDFSILPMAANLQIIFFRNEAESGRVLVKFLLNERDVAIPITSVAGVYYDWKAVREYMQGLVRNSGGI